MGDVQITNQQPKFWIRLVTAWAASSSLLSAGFAWVAFTEFVNYGPMAFLGQTPRVDRLGFTVNFVAIFVIAYPVEKWWIKPTYSAKNAAGIYAIVMGVIGLTLAGFATVTSVTNAPWTAIGTFTVFLFIAGMAVVVATIGRAFYAFLLQHRTTTYVLATVSVLTAMLLPI